MLKHLPKKSLETFQNELLYSNNAVIFKKKMPSIEEKAMQMTKMIGQIQILMIE